MIIGEIRVLPLGKINTIAIPRFILNLNSDDRYYFDDLLNMPYISDSYTFDNKTLHDFIVLKMNPIIKNYDKEYITLERTANCMTYRVKPKIYEKGSLYTVNGIRGNNIKIKVYSHDEKETELCNWVESNKDPNAYVLYWVTDYFGFLEGGEFYSYEAFSSRGKGHYLFLLPAKETILKLGNKQIKVKINTGERTLEAKVI